MCVWAPQEEGIVIKRMDSPWALNDRSGSWTKVKPEYVKARAGGRGPHAARRARMLRVCLAMRPHRKALACTGGVCTCRDAPRVIRAAC